MTTNKQKVTSLIAISPGESKLSRRRRVKPGTGWRLASQGRASPERTSRATSGYGARCAPKATCRSLPACCIELNIALPNRSSIKTDPKVPLACPGSNCAPGACRNPVLFALRRVSAFHVTSQRASKSSRRVRAAVECWQRGAPTNQVRSDNADSFARLVLVCHRGWTGA
jgi:hypothetical protein